MNVTVGQRRLLDGTYDAFSMLCATMNMAAPLHQAAILLKIAQANAWERDVQVQEIRDAVGLSAAAAGRAMGMLSERAYTGKDGLHLVEVHTDYQDRRRHPYRLTDKGERLVGRMLDRLGTAAGAPAEMPSEEHCAA